MVMLDPPRKQLAGVEVALQSSVVNMVWTVFVEENTSMLTVVVFPTVEIDLMYPPFAAQLPCVPIHRPFVQVIFPVAKTGMFELALRYFGTK